MSPILRPFLIVAGLSFSALILAAVAAVLAALNR